MTPLQKKVPLKPLKSKSDIPVIMALIRRYFCPTFPGVLIDATRNDNQGNERLDWDVQGSVLAASRLKRRYLWNQVNNMTKSFRVRIRHKAIQEPNTETAIAFMCVSNQIYLFRAKTIITEKWT